MHRKEGLFQRRSGLGLSNGGGILAYSHGGRAPSSAHGGLAAHHSARRRSSLGHSTAPDLLGSTTPQCPVRPTIRSRPAREDLPQPPAAVPRHRQQQHQQDAAPQTPASSPEVQELLKRLVRSNSATTVVKELSQWRETAPERQQQAAAAVVGTAALQVLTRVLGPGAKLSPQQRGEVQVRAKWLVAECAGLAGPLACCVELVAPDRRRCRVIQTRGRLSALLTCNRPRRCYRRCSSGRWSLSCMTSMRP